MFKKILISTVFLFCLIVSTTVPLAAQQDQARQFGPARSTERVREMLETRVSVEFDVDTSFEDMFNFYLEKVQVQFHLDRTVGVFGIVKSTPVVMDHFKLVGVPARQALRLVLREHDLDYIIDEGLVIIMPTEDAEKYLSQEIRHTPLEPLTHHRAELKRRVELSQQIFESAQRKDKTQSTPDSQMAVAKAAVKVADAEVELYRYTNQRTELFLALEKIRDAKVHVKALKENSKPEKKEKREIIRPKKMI